jgi:3beta-hydroxy-delta5-steroid dehydrogenase/steroid delta-isomerase
MMKIWEYLHFKLGIAEPLFSPHELNKLTISTVANSEAAKRDLGYAPIRSVADCMQECIEYYREQIAARA